MTNFQKDFKNKNKIFTPESAVVFIPVLIGSFISILLISFLIVPSYKTLKINKNELIAMELKRDQLPKLQQDLDAALLKLNNTKKQQSRILDLIGGSKSLETYLAKFDLIAKKAGVEITLIKPISVEYPSQSTSSGNLKNPNSINSAKYDPLLASNLEKRNAEIKISGTYKSLISFLKGIESLRTANISQEIEMRITNSNIPSNTNLNIILMNLSTYGYQNYK